MIVRQISAALGAEITEVDLAKVSDDQVEEIKSLLTEHKVIFFPGQKLSQDEHVEYGAKFGELEGHPNLKNKRVALVFGNEVDGVSQDSINRCDGSIEVPQWGTKHSFNISVSAGIVLWSVFQKTKP